MSHVGDRILNLPIEGVTSWARLLLALVAFIAVLVSDPSDTVSFVHAVLLSYLGFAVTLVLTSTRQPFKNGAAILIHSVDMAVSSLLMALTDGVTSPFYVFFLFTVLTGTLRWEWVGSVGTTLVLTLILLILYATDLSSLPAEGDLARTLIRAGFLLICGSMLGYMGAYRERARERFANLAQWPRDVVSDKLQGLEAALVHAGKVMRVPRMLAIWEEREEPHRHVFLWSSSARPHYTRESTQLFGDIVAPRYADRPFSWRSPAPGRRAQTKRSSVIDLELQRAISITTAATAPFRQATCRGWVFALDRDSFSDEDVSLISVIAARVGIELEERILRDQLATAAAEQERARLGRDLHDGVLQGLAAASIQLKVLSTAAEPELASQLKGVRDVLADEAHRIRGFVEATRKIAPAPAGLVKLEPEIFKRVGRLRELWSCDIETEVSPPDLTASLTATRSIAHMVGEAVANAARHGRAKRVKVRVESRGDRIVLSVQDDGNGFENLTGGFSAADLRTENAGPKSLRARVEDLGGTLYLTSSNSGTNITVELPA